MAKCADCGKEVHEESVVYCDMCGDPLCEECYEEWEQIYLMEDEETEE